MGLRAAGVWQKRRWTVGLRLLRTAALCGPPAQPLTPPPAPTPAQPKGAIPDYSSPVILKKDARSVEDFCDRIHKAMAKQVLYSWVWGKSVRHQPQRGECAPPPSCCSLLLAARAL